MSGEDMRDKVEDTGWGQIVKGLICWSCNSGYYSESNVETNM